MDNSRLEISARLNGSDSKLRALRAEGFIPGILYGIESTNQLIQLKEKEILKHFKENGTNSIFSVEFGGELIPVKMNEIQKDIINHKVVHVDLQRIEINKEIEISVPIQLNGQALGVKNGGTLQQHIRYVKVRALPSLMPESIVIDISSLDIGYNLYLKDINVVDDFKILNNYNTLILTILPPEISTESILDQLPNKETENLNTKYDKNTSVL